MQIKRILKGKYGLAASVSLVTYLIYLASLGNEFVNWDDGLYVVENPHIHFLNSTLLRWAFFDFYASNWHPLTWLSHALDYAAWGEYPLGYHLVNNIFHALNTFLVVVLAIRLVEVWKRTDANSTESLFINRRAILITGAVTGFLFGLHPLHVESVAWVAERKDLLCALFFLLCILRYIKYAGLIENKTGNTKPRFLNTQYLLALGFFTLALLSKPMAVTLPVILLILDWYPLKRIKSAKLFLSAFFEKSPFIALGLISSVLTILAQRAGGAMEFMEHLPLSTRMLVAAKALISYLWKMLLPLDLVPFYPYPKNVSLLSWEYLAPVTVMIVITAACVFAIKKQKIWLAAWGYYVATLIPVIGLVQVGRQAMADRYTYLPGLGPFFLFGLVVAWGVEKMNTKQNWDRSIKCISVVTAVAAIVFLSYLTIQQIGIWKNSITLWSFVIDKEPGKVSVAYYNRGKAYSKTRQFDKAIADYDKAIELNPSDYEAYNNRGAAKRAAGLFGNAIADYNQAIILKPGYFEATYNRGLAYFLSGRNDQALQDFNRAIDLSSNYAGVYLNRGKVYIEKANKELAASDFQKACALGEKEGCKALQTVYFLKINQR